MIKSLAVLFGVLAAMTAQAAADPLAGYRWSHRPVLVFAPNDADARYGAQSAAFARAGITERDIALITVAGDAVKAQPARGEPTAAQLRERFGVGDEDFAVILVGKDGGEKWRRNAVVDPAEIFGEIDAMPMRRQEMRERKS